MPSQPKDARRRILVISSDILPYPGMPTVGSGLRAWGLGQGLMSHGHEVLFSMPRDALTGRETLAPKQVLELAWKHDTLSTAFQAAEPDVVIICNWPVLALLPTDTLEVPIVLDQHGPHYLEREYQKIGEPEENARAKIDALSRADFFTCAGKTQWVYFQPWLERAGWTEQERREQTGVIPVSLSPDLPERNPADELTFVYGGVFLPWQDPSLGLHLLVQALERHKHGKLLFFGGKHPFYPVDSGIFDTLLAQLKQSAHVIAPGMVAHDTLIAEYTRAHVAIDLMKRNPERELAFTTRTVEYLWCGLPVIYNDYSELSKYIRQYDAGWIVDPEDQDRIVTVLDEIFEHPERLTERAQNAQRLVREQLTWDRTITPLETFVRHLERRPNRSSAKRVATRKNLNVQHLFSEARFHYRRGGLPTLWRETRSFFKKLAGIS